VKTSPDAAREERPMTVTVRTAPTTQAPTGARGAAQGTWLTTMLRPAGSLSGASGARFAAALHAVGDFPGVVFVDLRAVGPLPRTVRRALADADARLTAAGGALLVIDGATPSSTGRPPGPPPAHLLDPASDH
jgi:hypothetical protein